MTPECQALLMTDWRRSAAKTNKKGERGSPYTSSAIKRFAWITIEKNR